MDTASAEPLTRVMALHAIEYCERLFYLEEVEELRLADDRVYAGRTLHDQLEEGEEHESRILEDEALGITGRVDAVRRRDGVLVPYEHKRGRAHRGADGPEAWESDRVQLGAYALLLEADLGRRIEYGRVRYHADGVAVTVPIDEALRARVREAIGRARLLRRETERPPITQHEGRCVHCSLAPVCLPEEERASVIPSHRPLRLFPPDDDRRPVHVLGHGTRVGRKSMELAIDPRDAEPTTIPIRRVRSVTIHGYASVSAQALDLCARHDVDVHWMSAGGFYVGSFHGDQLAVQRRIRQYEGLRDPELRLRLARALVHAKTEDQLRFVLRATRKLDREALGLDALIAQLREAVRHSLAAADIDTLLGYEGAAARAYFAILPRLVAERVPAALRPEGRSRRPPRDPFNAALSFGYELLSREVVQAIRSVGLEPGFGFYHQPRSAAPPLALDLIELFRVRVVDMAVLAAINRLHLDPEADFERAGPRVWLSTPGRRKLVTTLEARLDEPWRHPVLGYSLSHRRAIELEVRLLEKEWSGSPGSFARSRLR